MTADTNMTPGIKTTDSRSLPRTDGEHVVDVSVIMPCLNEAIALPSCIEEALEAITEMGVSGEVIVVDNGSIDGSSEIARRAGARVVQEPRRGYGNACRRGFAEARGRFLVLGDADGTYGFNALPGFIVPLLDGADMVMGTRLGGSIEVNAMPWLHRHVGNPLLTRILNLLFSPGVSDAHCGLRSITRESYGELRLGSTGMEFASELLIAASRRGFRIVEVPIRYRRRAGGEPKLRTFRDGWRHLRLMITYAVPRSERHAALSRQVAIASSNGVARVRSWQED